MLSEKRKGDRAKMVQGIFALAQKLAIVAEVKISEGESTVIPRGTMVHLQDANGLAIYVDFDGQSVQPNVYVLSWHMRDNDRQLSDAFAGAEAVNMFHRRKATQVAYGFVSLCEQLEAGFEKSRTGLAYQPQG